MADFFFSHENQSYPPSLSNYEALRSSTNADLLVCVSELVPHHDTVKPHEANMVILDGDAVVNMIIPRTPISFDGYVRQVMEYVRKQFRGDVQRKYVVFDAYWKDSMKAATRTKRGKCIWRHVAGNKQVPSNWEEFLRADENKSELFHLISDRIVDEEFPGLVIVTRDDEVLSSAPCDLAGLISWVVHMKMRTLGCSYMPQMELNMVWTRLFSELLTQML